MKKLLRFIPAFIIMAVIFFFSAQDADSSTQLSDSIVSITAGEENVGIRFFTVIVRKGAHFLEYAALGAALCFGF
ncbi:MAG: VanZ family protein, partial [Clostridia bacterium]|nr:VanZ family protein [Clostridia bacterium]